jgi:hypothetical protein
MISCSCLLGGKVSRFAATRAAVVLARVLAIGDIIAI